ncbi:MAG: hypothetical protein WCE45_01470, partial [Sedimentisphaerales bacterium]
PLVVAAISSVIGAIITIIITNIRNKSGVFGYITFFNRIGLSADDSIFGSVRVNWQGHAVRNLYSYTITVENSTSKDYENIEFKLYSGPETIILNEKAEILNSPYAVLWSDSYKQKMYVAEGQVASALQQEEYNHSREYNVPVFNRGQKICFTYLCTKLNDDFDPGIFISTSAKGIRLKRQKNPFVILKPIFGVPVPIAIVRAFIISVLVVILCGLFVKNIWIASIVSMFVGLTAQTFGAIVYRVEKFIRHTISG